MRDLSNQAYLANANTNTDAITVRTIPPLFDDSFESIVGKEKILVTSLFFFKNVFHPMKNRNYPMSSKCFTLCKCSQIGTV